MHANQMAVAGQPHVAFDTVGALFERKVISGQRVFGASRRCAPVGNNKGVPGEHLVGATSFPYAAGSCPSNSTGAAMRARRDDPRSTTTQRCAGRSTGLRTNPSKTRATVATVAAASR